MAVIAVTFFQFPKNDFSDVLQHINIMRYNVAANIYKAVHICGYSFYRPRNDGKLSEL